MARHVARLLCFVLVFALTTIACVRRDSARETMPLQGDIRDYWTCAVTFASDGRGEDANEAFTFVPWLEQRIRERGVFEPLERRDAKEAEITLRVDATGEDDRVLLRVLFIDTKSKAEIGEIEATGLAAEAKTAAPVAAEPAPTDTTETRRATAMRAAADRILDVLKEKRRIASLQPKAAPAPPPAELPTTTVAGGAVCSTQCVAPASTHATHDDMYRVSAGIDPTLRALRECLDRVGGQLVVPAVLLRFGPDGRMRHVRVDVGGYEELECIQLVRSRPVRAATSRATILRCELKCSSS